MSKSQATVDRSARAPEPRPAQWRDRLARGSWNGRIVESRQPLCGRFGAKSRKVKAACRGKRWQANVLAD